MLGLAAAAELGTCVGRQGEPCSPGGRSGGCASRSFSLFTARPPEQASAVVLLSLTRAKQGSEKPSHLPMVTQQERGLGQNRRARRAQKIPEGSKSVLGLEPPSPLPSVTRGPGLWAPALILSAHRHLSELLLWSVYSDRARVGGDCLHPGCICRAAGRGPGEWRCRLPAVRGRCGWARAAGRACGGQARPGRVPAGGPACGGAGGGASSGGTDCPSC